MSTMFKRQAKTRNTSVHPTVSDEQNRPQQSNGMVTVTDGGPPQESISDYEQIARLVHSFWQERGCPIGSPEEDWFLAEQAIQLHKLRKEVGRENPLAGGEQAMSKSA